ncbi:MAG: FN3 associated domain-containing protein [Chitinivibrionales bacterium]|nr:FN3 associated domain-containing protein [Chitinivibrionales bacterium]
MAVVRLRGKCFLFFLALFFFRPPSVHAQDPTPQQVVSGWATFSGNKAGKVLFGRTNKVWVLDLKTGLANSVADFPVYNSNWGASASYRFSPGGTRIACQNNNTLIVMNADGSNQKTIWQGSIAWDLIVADWDGDSAVAYSTFDKVVRTQIHPDNSAGTTQILVTNPAGGIGFCSVCKSGDYVCYIDIAANQASGGYHRPMVRNVRTNAVIELVARNSDGCQLRLKPDGSGTSIFCEQTHATPATIKNFSNVKIDNLSIPPGAAVEDYGFRWTYDANFLIHLSDNGVYIRKMDAGKEYFFIGSNMMWPDLWEGDTALSSQVAQPQITPGDSQFSDSVVVTLTSATAGAALYYTANGTMPTNLSTVYSGPFTLKSSAIIKAIGYKSGMAASPVASRNYVSVVLRTPENPDRTVPGLDYRYFTGTWSVLPDFTALSPQMSDTVRTFDISPKKSNNGFSFIFTGYISISTAGSYAFYVNAADGADLYIGNTLIVNNDGLHAAREKSGTIGLKAGMHSVTVAYFNTTNPAVLTVSYAGPGIAKETIPAAVLFRPDPNALRSITFIGPKAGDVYKLGDSLPVSWQYSGGKGFMVVPEISLDNGITFTEMFDKGYVQNTESGAIKWLIPSDDTSYVSNKAKIRIHDYTNVSINTVSGAFAIGKNTGVTLLPYASFPGFKGNISQEGRGVVRYRNPIVAGAQSSLRIYRLDGKPASMVSNRTNSQEWVLSLAPSGCYLLKLVDKNNTTVDQRYFTVVK